MGNMILYVDDFQSAPYSLPCYSLDFASIWKHRTEADYHRHGTSHKPTLEEPWVTHCFEADCIFNTTADPPQRYEIVKKSELPASFLPAFQWQHASSSRGYLQPKAGTYSVISSKPDDWEKICTKRIATRSTADGRINLSTYTDWNQLSTYAAQNNREILLFNYPIAMLFMATGGLKDFSFGISNCFNYQVTGAGYNRLSSGCCIQVPQTGINQGIGWTTTASSFSFTDLNTAAILISGQSCADYVPQTTQEDPEILHTQSYPVEYLIPKGTTLQTGFTTTTDYQMYGVLSVCFNRYGIAQKFIVQSIDRIMWDITQGQSGNAAGPDTNSQGGHGKQGAGTDNPYNPITRNRNGGILTDPTASAGFVIYKFTPSQFTDFLNKFYTETALPSLSALTPARQPSAETPILDYLANLKGWSNADNIVFVKTSPVSFPSQPASLSKLSIGALGISNITAEVVTDYIAEDSRDLGSFGSAAQWFTDVEPYAAATLYFPLAGAVSIPPSILEGASGTVHYAFNLLNNGCGYSLHLQKEGSSLFYAKNGEACKSADCVIPGRNITETVGAVGALAATGISTLATGGTAAPALLTTALGAATTAVHDSIDMSISNLPPNSSGSPYDDTVNGGLRDIFLYRPKAVRFNSGEQDNNNERSQVMGTFSYRYLSSLDQISEGSYFSVMDIKLDMADGMTKAEHDKIIALLKEGVWM